MARKSKRILRRNPVLRWDPWQIAFLNCKGDKILCKGRQIGGSEIAAADCGEYVKENPKTQPVVMIAPTERQANGLFNKTLGYLLNHYPKLVIVEGIDRPTKTKINLTTGVEIYCLPVGKTGLGVRFLTIGRLYKEECSQIPELVHEAVDPALLTTGGDEIQISTPFGAIGTFYETWINKDGAYDSFTRFSATSEVVMRERPICATWTQKQRDKSLMKLEQAKKRWSKKRYAQEYLGEFIADLHRWFSEDLIGECCIAKRPESIMRDKEYYMGCDLARMGEDDGSCEIIWKNEDKLIHVENIITRKQLTTETEKRIIALDNQYDFSKIFIDAGAGTLGVSVLDHLLDLDQTKKKVVAIDNAKRKIDRDGHKVRLMKVDLYENLKSLMEQGRITLLDDEDIIESLRSVQYEYVMKDGEPTTLRIFGNYTHIVEGLIRAAWCVQYKSINMSISWM